MLKATKKVLEASIKLWEGHVAHGGYDRGAKICALCIRFDEYGPNDERCVLTKGKTREKCPIYEKTGKRGCVDTAFYDPGFGIERAKRMLKFLKDLR